jgi:hypothetical protein
MQVMAAHPAVSAGDVKRDDDAIADVQLRDPRSDGLDDSHRLVPEHVSGIEERSEHGVEMQVRSAQPR